MNVPAMTISLHLYRRHKYSITAVMAATTLLVIVLLPLLEIAGRALFDELFEDRRAGRLYERFNEHEAAARRILDFAAGFRAELLAFVNREPSSIESIATLGSGADAGLSGNGAQAMSSGVGNQLSCGDAGSIARAVPHPPARYCVRAPACPMRWIRYL